MLNLFKSYVAFQKELESGTLTTSQPTLHWQTTDGYLGINIFSKLSELVHLKITENDTYG